MIEEKLKDEEIKQVAIDEAQQDWNDLSFRQVHEEGFVKGANWAKTKLLSICKSEIAEACKKQREICARAYLNERGYNETANSIIANVIRVAPSPLDEVKK